MSTPIWHKLKPVLHRNMLQNLPLQRTAFRILYKLGALCRRYPNTAAALRESDLFKKWWYYGVELLPGVIIKGQYQDEIPLLPRILLRNCELAGMDCLDLGSMEGLIPLLMKRQGARKVLATDATFHCYSKLRAIQNYYGVDFQFEQVGLMYDLASKITRRGWKGFDLINLSGLLYHVFSPMHTLAGVRPLLRKNGLIIVSTNIVDRPGFSMEFNHSGKLQAELNTFWYLTVPLFDYILRYFKLRPIDALYHPHAEEDTVRSTSFGPTGYLSVVCRAEDEVVSQSGDEWMKNAFLASWERIALCNNDILSRQPASGIGYSVKPDPALVRKETESVDLSLVIREKRIARATDLADSHLVRLDDHS